MKSKVKPVADIVAPTVTVDSGVIGKRSFGIFYWIGSRTPSLHSGGFYMGLK